jgi:hypothetical protein
LAENFKIKEPSIGVFFISFQVEHFRIRKSLVPVLLPFSRIGESLVLVISKPWKNQ